MDEARKRRREDPEARRVQILDAARRAFRAFGFRATTVDRIASEAGVSVGLLYRFFPSKAEIVRAIILEDQAPVQEIEEALKKASARPDTLPQLIADQVMTSPLALDRFALQFEIAAEVCRDDALRAFLRGKYREIGESLAEDAGGFPGGREGAQALVDQLSIAGAVATGLAMHAVLYADPPSLDPELVVRLMATVFAPAGRREGDGSRDPAP